MIHGWSAFGVPTNVVDTGQIAKNFDRTHIVLLRYGVSHAGQRLGTAELGRTVLAHAMHRDVAAQGSQMLRKGTPESAAYACDERGLSLKCAFDQFVQLFLNIRNESIKRQSQPHGEGLHQAHGSHHCAKRRFWHARYFEHDAGMINDRTEEAVGDRYPRHTARRQFGK
jgi:hypothetical protein